jgi:DNA-binding CsgD family transcriptional regulator
MPSNPDRLGLDLYAAVLDGVPLDRPIAAIVQAVGGTMGVATRFLAGSGAPGPLTRVTSINIDPGMAADYQAHWVAHDPWIKAMHGMPTGVYNLSRIIPPDDVQRTPFWNDLLARRAPTLHGLCLAMLEDGVAQGYLTAWRDPARGAFDTGGEALLARLQPHITRALVAERRLVTACVATDALDTLPQGVAVIGHDGRLCHANRALGHMVAGNDGLALAPSGLAMPCHTTQRALDRAVGLALLVALGQAPMPDRAITVAVRRPSGAQPWQVEVLPLPPGRSGMFGPWAGAVLLVSAPAPRIPAAEDLRRAYGLTAAECALALALTRGATLAEHAAANGISVATVRSHLARLLAKTETRRQAELVARLLRATEP